MLSHLGDNPGTIGFLLSFSKHNTTRKCKLLCIDGALAGESQDPILGQTAVHQMANAGLNLDL